MSEFKVGDRVKAKASYDGFDGGRPGVGTVVRIDARDDTALIRFDDWSGGHAGYADEGVGDQWWMRVDDLEPAAAERFMVAIFNPHAPSYSTFAEAEARA